MATKSQLSKIKKLADNIHSLWLEVNESSDIYSSKEINSMQFDIDKNEEKLNRYCIEIGISETQLFSIDVMCDLLDGVSYEEYMSNYK